jgi:hypothetical protein
MLVDVLDRVGRVTRTLSASEATDVMAGLREL